MLHNRNEEPDQCFVRDEPEEVTVSVLPEECLPSLGVLGHHLPANELRAVQRPDALAPRTLFLDIPLYLLKEGLNRPCLETLSEVTKKRLKSKIHNQDNATLEEYFSDPSFSLIYNKLGPCHADTKSFTGRLKNIDMLADYNWRLFRDLEFQLSLQDCSFDQRDSEDQFDSNFECGNLCRVYSRSSVPHDYYLLIENDINTHGYNNWFFFRLRIHRPGVRRINILNFVKKTCFYEEGMLVSIYSSRKRSEQGTAWFKAGDNLTFETSAFFRSHHENQKYRSLSFEYNCQFEDDQIYFALSQPYTYTRLASFLEQIEYGTTANVVVKPLSYSLANNILPTVSISAQLPAAKPKQIVVFLARQHPCETVGSFIAEFLMKQLTQGGQVAQALLDQFQFVFVPMINPDGVIHGTSRCSLSGLDLNRQWSSRACKGLSPETVKVRAYLVSLSKQAKIKYIIDLHGHGKKLNSFFFACRGAELSSNRLMSMAMSKLQPRFDIYGCNYGITRDKESTVRSQMYEMGVAKSYTLESSLFGWKNEGMRAQHYNETDYESIAASLLKSICCLECPTQRVFTLMGFTKQWLQGELSGMLQRLVKEEAIHHDDKQVLSQSDPEGDGLSPQELKAIYKHANIKKKNSASIPKVDLKPKKSLRKTDSMVKHKDRSVKELPFPTQDHLQLTYLQRQAKGLRHTEISTRNTQKKLSIKWNEKRKIIAQKRRKDAEVKLSKEMTEKYPVRDYTKNNLRSKLYSEVSRKINEDESPVNEDNAKKRAISSKMKTHATEIAEGEGLNVRKEGTQVQDVLRSQLDVRFKQLKEESLSMLLTNTLSILKAKPQEMGRGVKKKSMRAETETGRQCSSRNSEQKYNKFKNFIKHGSIPKKPAIQSNSVFYYFPIL